MAHLGFEETELRLGLPGDQANRKVSTKREFEETVDLKLELKLQTTSNSQEEKSETVVKPPTPVTKARAVGWPPVRSYRKNVVMKSVQPEKVTKLEPEGGGDGNPGLFVKVSMDGAPYLRKLDLNIYHNYKDLSLALDKLFDSFANNGSGSSMDLKNGFSEYVTTYQDKDGDWMLVGDVPWNMFVESCKRLRLIKGSEATGFAPKSRNRC